MSNDNSNNNNNLLSINVNELFEKYSVHEIDHIYKKLQNDIEMKKEELRTMVGERYRDLLQAADTIGNMRKTSEIVIEHINEITSSVRNLNEKQLIGFKIDRQQQMIMSNGNHNQLADDRTKIVNYGITVQIQLLIVLPELIWTNIDEENYFVATQLYLFSRHISTGLQLNASNNNSTMKLFPIAKRQWTILSRFFFTIKQSCLMTLEREDLSPDVATKCLASLLLLENCEMDKLLEIFMKLRAKAFQYTIDETNGKYERVRDRILASLKVLIGTLELLYTCFCCTRSKSISILQIDNNRNNNNSNNNNNDGGLLMEEIKKLIGDEGRPTITLLIGIERSPIFNTLPEIISKYKPHIQINQLQSDKIKQTIGDWLTQTRINSQSNLLTIINIISSIKIIYDIERKSSQELEKPSQWVHILQTLSLPSHLDLYQLYYKPLINQRITDIIRKSWAQTIRNVNQSIIEILQGPITDTRTFVWTEESSDIPLRLKEALSSDKQCHKLLMKTKGYIPALVDVVQLMDTSLKMLYDDLNLYMENVGVVENDRMDSIEIVTFLKDCSRDGISEFITNIKSMDYKQSENNIIFLARFLQSLTELSTHLKSCLNYQLKEKFSNNLKSSFLPTSTTTATTATTSTESTTTSLSNSTSTNHWQMVCGLLEEESVQFWKLWLEIFWKKIHQEHPLQLADNLITMLNEIPNWDTVNIEEKDEQGAVVISKIRIPLQPSFQLQLYLHHICNELNVIVPHTLPRLISNQLTECIINVCHKSYDVLCTNEFVCSNQNISLQYIYDIKFINILFGTRENRRVTESLLQPLQNRFKSNIDPFDFELFSKYLNQNVKKAIERMQYQLGCLIVNMEHLTTVLGGGMTSTTGIHSQHDKDPNVLALSTTNLTSTNANWSFTLLPVTIPGKISGSGSSQTTSDVKEKEMARSQIKKSSQMHSSSANVTTIPIGSSSSVQNSTMSQQQQQQTKSSASSFFGVMSQDWFR